MAGQWQAVGVYPVMTQTVSAGAKTEIGARVDVLTALITPSAQGAEKVMASPEFDRLHPSLAQQILAEIAALKVVLTTGP